jgi:hypothetical protein
MDAGAAKAPRKARFRRSEVSGKGFRKSPLSKEIIKLNNNFIKVEAHAA